MPCASTGTSTMHSAGGWYLCIWYVLELSWAKCLAQVKLFPTQAGRTGGRSLESFGSFPRFPMSAPRSTYSTSTGSSTTLISTQHSFAAKLSLSACRQNPRSPARQQPLCLVSLKPLANGSEDGQLSPFGGWASYPFTPLIFIYI